MVRLATELVEVLPLFDLGAPSVAQSVGSADTLRAQVTISTHRRAKIALRTSLRTCGTKRHLSTHAMTCKARSCGSTWPRVIACRAPPEHLCRALTTEVMVGGSHDRHDGSLA